jgi:hypothetical protein
MVSPSGNNEANEQGGRLWYGEQDANGVDLSLIRENLKLTPSERLLRGDRARQSALQLLEYGRQQRKFNAESE